MSNTQNVEQEPKCGLDLLNKELLVHLVENDVQNFGEIRSEAAMIAFKHLAAESGYEMS